MVAPRHPFFERFAESSGGFLPPLPPAEQTAARQYQARKSGTGDGTWDGGWINDDIVNRHA